MTRRMYDAVTPSNMPSGGQLYAYYVDGLYANGTEVKSRFPGKIYVPITIGNTAAYKGLVLDCEPGDASPSAAVAWCTAYPGDNSDLTVYCDTSTWPSVRQAFQSAGVTEPNYWVAQYDNNPVIPSGAIAKQYATGNYDTSIVADHWPGVDAVATTPAPASNTGSTPVTTTKNMPLPWNGAGAVAFAKLAASSNFQDWTNRCGEFCAMAHGYGGSGWNSAADQGAAQSLNKNQSAASQGDVHFWVQQGNWGAGNGHIALQSETAGQIYSNDLDVEGKITKTSITGPVNKWGQVYMGWAHAADAFSQSWGTNPYYTAKTTTTTPAAPAVNKILLETSMASYDVPNVFGADVNGSVLPGPASNKKVIAFPPQGLPQFGANNTQLQFACDFGVAKLRVATRGGVSQSWRVQLVTVDSSKGNSYISLEKGELIASVVRMPVNAADKTSVNVPVTMATWSY